ncbi:hypothetical protein [Pectobacterium aroidearum]|uniref:hypothetical protein n=1 Tax=Pectobacterium aroidearum TaxID=1201031 RepID=UPI0015F09C83|nr:hypothetical protein [Pectobacterium aroidearum]MBA5229609.1 hypothetical protein [Pectobacterium aroidearum]MBA5739145.1 hypothetical protein [Pectobacterium aroidearum]UXK00566.1 hypothetical protein N5056_00765 [Pectobacterium aroidearum]
MGDMSINTTDLTFSSKDRLRKALQDNVGTYTISQNGHVQLNLNNDAVMEAIRHQIESLPDVEANDPYIREREAG